MRGDRVPIDSFGYCLLAWVDYPNRAANVTDMARVKSKVGSRATVTPVSSTAMFGEGRVLVFFQRWRYLRMGHVDCSNLQ